MVLGELNPGDMWLICGDVFDGPLVAPEDIKGILDLMHAALEYGIHIAYISGNHDSLKRDEVAQRKSFGWDRFFAERFEHTFLPEGSGRFISEEWDSESNLPKVFTVPTSPEVTVCPINARSKTRIREIMNRMPRHYADFLLLHQSVEGVVPNIGDPDLAPKDITGKCLYAALGDLHFVWSELIQNDPVEDSSDSFPTLMAYPGPMEWSRVNEVEHCGAIYGRVGDDMGVTFEHVSNPFSRRIVNLDVFPMTFNSIVSELRQFFEIPKTTDWSIQAVPGTVVTSYDFEEGVKWIGNRHALTLNVRYPSTPDGSGKDAAKEVANRLEELRAAVPDPETLSIHTAQIPKVDTSFGFADVEGNISESENTSFLSMPEAINRMHDEDKPDATRIALEIWDDPGHLFETLNDYVAHNTTQQLLPAQGEARDQADG
jgi:hypothetical protein